MTPSFLIYGAYGYTGALTARFAVERGLSPVLAGRDADQLKSLAGRLDLEHVVCSLDDSEALDAALGRVAAVLHCAGPFAHTYERMAAACLRTGTHYFDITGEIPVYTALAQLDQEARERGVMLLPGIGFDVVPTDCLAAHLAAQLPTANHLALALCSNGPAGITRGTAKTVVEGLGRPGFIRKDGELSEVPHLSEDRLIDFGHGVVRTPRMVVADVFSAYRSTGIPNIETYVRLPGALRVVLKGIRPIGPVLATGFLHRAIERMIDFGPVGPTDSDRARTHTIAWGEVTDDQNNVLTMSLRMPESYTFTARSALEGIGRAISGDAPPGYHTPSSAYGADFVFGIEGVEWHSKSQ